MNFNQEDIYRLVCKDDKVAALTLKTNSEGFKKYGKEPTVVFQYTQRERNFMDKQLLENTATNGVIRAKVLFYGLAPQIPETKEMEYIELNSQDIEDIYSFPFSMNKNTFHSSEERSIEKLEIEFDSLPKGKDWDWFYGFEKMRVEEKGIILSPEEQYQYLALKLFYEQHNLSEEEKADIFVSENKINENVGFYYFKILDDKDLKVKDEVIENLEKLFYKRMYEKTELLNKYLVGAGSSLNKLMRAYPNIASRLLMKLVGFRQKRLNVSGRFPIYMDENSLLHIMTRHVEGYKFNNHFEKKINFQWVEEDVSMVINKVIEEIDDEYQIFRTQNPTSRYSRFNDQSVYFEGDYYTLHIEPNGRISTLYKNKKLEQ